MGLRGFGTRWPCVSTCWHEIRQGIVYDVDEHPWCRGTSKRTNNTRKIEAIGHSLAWMGTLMHLDGGLQLVSDSAYAIAACQGMQRCSSYVRLVHTVRRTWRRAADVHSICATHVKGHSGDPWNELVDSLATAAMRTAFCPRMGFWVAPWYLVFSDLDVTPVITPLLPFVAPMCTDPRPWYTARRRKPNTAALR
jgi:ribonuclease HI